MKKIKKILVLSCILTTLVIPVNSFAAISDYNIYKSNNINLLSNGEWGTVKYDGVILNSYYQSNGVALGLVNTGDRFTTNGITYTSADGRKWYYVHMLSGNNAGRYGYLYVPYVNIHGCTV